MNTLIHLDFADIDACSVNHSQMLYTYSSTERAFVTSTKGIQHVHQSNITNAFLNLSAVLQQGVSPRSPFIYRTFIDRPLVTALVNVEKRMPHIDWHLHICNPTKRVSEFAIVRAIVVGSSWSVNNTVVVFHRFHTNASNIRTMLCLFCRRVK